MTQPPIDPISILSAIPGNHLILLPDAPRFTILAATDAYLAATYMQRHDLLGKGVFEVFFDDAQQGQARVGGHLKASLSEVIRTKRLHRMDVQRYDVFNTQLGSVEYKVWQPSNWPVLDQAGQLRCIIHTVDDITSQVQLMEITEANRYLQTIINLFKEPMQVLQPVFANGEIIDFRFRLTNQAYADYANTTPEQLQGKLVSEVFPGYFQTVSFTNPVLTYQTGQPLTFEVHYDKDGLDLYNRMSTVRLDDDIVIHFTDFTHLRQLQLQLEGKVDELSRSNENLQEFAYIASHDLQEPLRKIQLFGELLRNEHAGELGEGITYLERMQRAAERMSTLITDLLTYSRLTTQPEASVPVSLDKVINRVLGELDLSIEETGAQIAVDPLPTVTGDRLQLGQLFQNLVSNALKFRRPGVNPHIHIRYWLVAASVLPEPLRPPRAVANYHQIDVTDNGIGFDEQHAERIFQVFQRLHGKGEFAGTGIGLAICKKVVINHGGAITVTSQVGQGSTFRIYLPA